MVPVCWQNSGGCPTPNPIANYMVQSWCSKRLVGWLACNDSRMCTYSTADFGHNRYTVVAVQPAATGHHLGHHLGLGHHRASVNPGCRAVDHNGFAMRSKMLPSAQNMLASTPAPQSPLSSAIYKSGFASGRRQQIAIGTVPATGYGQPAAN